jgi:hypothetical protein
MRLHVQQGQKRPTRRDLLKDKRDPLDAARHAPARAASQELDTAKKPQILYGV